jgi:hypothetical protein
MKLTHLLIIAILTCTLGLVVSCKKSPDTQSTPPINLPVVTTKPVTFISATSVVSGGELENATNITDKGIIWGIDSTLLTVSNVNKISNGASLSNYTDTVQNLQPNTTYYLRAYAIYGSGALYGATIKFTTLQSQPTVYIAGYNGSTAAYWKNGKLISLTNGTIASSIYADGTNVHVAGEYNDGRLRAVYWKNGTAQFLTDGNNAALGKSIYVAGNDVYIAGYELFKNDPYLPVAKYWKNGVAVSLTASTNNGGGVANAIQVVGSDVYTAGFTSNLSMGRQIATYWKNNTIVPLSDSNTSIAAAQSIFVAGNDVYVAGRVKPGLGLSGVPIATYWKNGVAVSLSNGSGSAVATSIYVSGSDVYVAGFDHDGTAQYWKNGVTVPLTDGTKYASAQSIHVVGNDVHVAGYEMDENAYKIKAKYWKNVVSQPLETSSDFSSALSIFVK